MLRMLDEYFSKEKGVKLGNFMNEHIKLHI